MDLVSNSALAWIHYISIFQTLFQSFITFGQPLLQMFLYSLMHIRNMTNRSQQRTVTWQRAYRLVESKLWLADTAFISLSHCRQDCSAEFMLDPSLTHAYSAFPLNGQGTKLHNMISI